MCLAIPAQLVEVIEPGLANAEVSGVRREVSTVARPRRAGRRLGARPRRVRAAHDRRRGGGAHARPARGDRVVAPETCHTCGDVARRGARRPGRGRHGPRRGRGRPRVRRDRARGAGRAPATCSSATPGSRSGRSRLEVRRRVQGRRARPASRSRDRGARARRRERADHGGLRRAHARDRQARPRGSASGRGRVPARPGLPGLRDPDGAGRRRDLARRAPERHLHDVRRHAARPRRPRDAARGEGSRRRRPHGLLAARRAGDRAGRARAARSSSSRSASRPLRRRPPSRSCAPARPASATSPPSRTTSRSSRRCGRSSTRRARGSTPSSRPGTSRR